MNAGSIVRLIVACGVSLSAGLIGSLVVAGNFTTWYATVLNASIWLLNR